jgi:hypothetical protein
LIMIPGNIGFLHDVFQVLVVVSNTAPPLSQIDVTSATATLELPFGDNGQPDFPGPDATAHDRETISSDDPLWPAVVANPPPTPAACSGTGALDPRLCTGVSNAADAAGAFGPGQQGQGEFLLEGRIVGTHRLRVTINATLTLSTGQPVALTGKAIGTVQVRDRNFNLSISHPDVVRAGET